MLVYYYSRINGRIKIRCTLWSPQLPPAELAQEIEEILKGVDR